MKKHNYHWHDTDWYNLTDYERTKILALVTKFLFGEEQEAIDQKLKDDIEELDSYLALIEKLNIPRFYSDEEGELLEKIAEKQYVDLNGETKYFIEAAEFENLKVKKGNLTGYH